jgi:hypothetical protein
MVSNDKRVRVRINKRIELPKQRAGKPGKKRE